jgi:hypothetical protein
MTTETLFPSNAYVAIDTWGDCKVCGKHQDLRYGSCFDCSDHVAGKAIPGGHELWDSRNPSNRWQVKTN